MNLKVMLFVLVLLLFVGSVTYVAINRFNTLTGYASNDTYYNNSNVYIGAVMEILFLVILFFILSFVIKTMFNYHEVRYNHEMDTKYNYSKRLIPLDLSHPSE